MRIIALVEGSLLCNRVFHRVIRVKLLALEDELQNARIFDFFGFFRFSFGHVTCSTEFGRRQVTRTAINCKDERNINRGLRIGSGHAL